VACRCKGEEGPRTASPVVELGRQEWRAGAAAHAETTMVHGSTAHLARLRLLSSTISMALGDDGDR
jgi:alpha-beta hydrolase superfamily lysophospholipase